MFACEVWKNLKLKRINFWEKPRTNGVKNFSYFEEQIKKNGSSVWTQKIEFEVVQICNRFQ